MSEVRSCAVDECTKKPKSRGLCGKHYMDARRRGDFDGKPIPRPTDLERFYSKLRKTDSCWEWTSPPSRSGYGQFWAKGQFCLAHRYAHEQFKGEIPDGYEVDHLCFNRICVNPDHLEAVTPKENTRRAHDRRASECTCIVRHEHGTGPMILHHWCRCEQCAAMRWPDEQINSSPHRATQEVES